jgi:DNA replication and repair protein RecF
MMFLRSLSVADFRNYRSADLTFCRGLVILCGPNAQGKTNLLEAAFFALRGRSFRTHDAKSLIRDGTEAARSQVAAVTHGGIEVTCEAAIGIDGARMHRRNGVRVRRSRQHASEAAVVPICADDSRIITDEPAVRREFLDSELSQLDPRYSLHLAGYKKALEQKARLLRRGLEGYPVTGGELSSWNVELSTHGAVLVRARRDLVASLSDAANDAYRTISAGREELSIRYDSKAGCSGTDGEIGERILEDLAEIAEAEIASGRCLRGPHRDDITFLLNGNSAKEYASRGQVRSAVLAARIALMSMLQQANDEPPLVLFDDFDNDLDERRRSRVLALLDGAQQVFLAAHDLRSCASIDPDRADVFDVEEGKVNAARTGVCAVS